MLVKDLNNTLVCLLTSFLIAFAVGNSLLESPSQETVAFKGFDRNKWYLPAVTLFLAEEVEWNLGDKDVRGCQFYCYIGYFIVIISQCRAA